MPPPLLAHPLTETGVLPVSPALAAALAGASVLAAALLWPSRKPAPPPSGTPVASWEESLTRGQMSTRTVSVALMVLAVLAGRLGSDRELENVAPALIIGVGWPAMLALSATLGPAWRWLDPWDAVARTVRGGEEPREGGGAVFLSLVPAVAWTWYLGVYPDSLSPRSVGVAVGLYFLATVGACLAMGRVWWLSRAEVFGILFSWLARLPRGLLRVWDPPRGASLLLGALAGGLVFGELRRTELWGELNVIPGATLWATLALVGAASLGALTLHLLDRWGARRGMDGSVAAATVAAVGSIGLALAMARSRLFTSIQLLPTVLVDPFGFGWDLWGSSGRTVEVPLAPGRLAIVQLTVLMAGHLAGAFILAGRTGRTRAPGALALGLLMAAAAATVVLAPGL